MHQYAFIAVDEGDRAIAGARGGEARVIGEHAGFGIELAHIDDFWPSRTLQNREIPALTVLVVG